MNEAGAPAASPESRSPVTLVTGAAGGIGRALVQALLREGHDVLASARQLRDLPALAALAAPGRRLVCVAADVATSAGRAEIEASLLQSFGGLTGLINNAAVGTSSIRADYHQRPVTWREIDSDTLHRFLDTNAHAPVALTLQLLPHFTRGWGRVLNVGTSLAAMLRPGFLAYAMSKAALESATAILGRELQGTGITVNLLNPGGPIDTPMTRRDAGPQSRTLIPADVMAAPVCWLVSQASGAITAQRITATRWQGPQHAEAFAPAGWPQLANDSSWNPV